MFSAAAGVWVLIVVAGFVFATGRPARLLSSDRFAVPAYMVALVAAVVVGVAPLAPPAVDGAPDEDAFSTDRAREHIDVVARQPHPIGTAADDEVRRYIADQLRGLGLDPVFQAVSAPDYYGVSNAPIEVVNVMARIPGSASTGAIALVAHYRHRSCDAGRKRQRIRGGRGLGGGARFARRRGAAQRRDPAVHRR